MEFANPWGLLALAGIPAVLALHLFRQRFRPRPVAGLFLWRAAGSDPTGGRRIDRLRSTVSLWLELLMMLLLALLLADPRRPGIRGPEHLVVVLDDSASMAAGGEQPVAARVEQVVRERLESTPSGSAVTIVRSGTAPRLLAGPAASIPEALSRLAEWKPIRRAHDLAPALSLAHEIAGEAGSLLLLSDRLPEATPPRFEAVALGQSLDNAALLDARRESEGGRETLALGVEAFARRDLLRRLVVRLEDGTELLREELRLAAGRPQTLRLELPATVASTALEIRLEPADALPLDDAITLLPTPDRTVRWKLLLEAGPLREAAARALRAVRQTAAAEDADPADLLVGSGDAALDGVGLRLLPAVADAPTLLGPFFRDGRHALMRGVPTEGLAWGGAAKRAVPGAAILVAADRVLAAHHETDKGWELLLNGVAEEGNLLRAPAWPILIQNLVEEVRRGLPGAEQSNLRCGEEIVWRRRRPGVASVRLRAPDGQEVSLRTDRRGRLRTAPLDLPGTWVLREGDRELARWRVSLADREEADLREAREGRRSPTAVREERLGETPAADRLIDPRFHFGLLGALGAAWLLHAVVLRPKGGAR